MTFVEGKNDVHNDMAAMPEHWVQVWLMVNILCNLLPGKEVTWLGEK